jgi:hypothetical protein
MYSKLVAHGVFPPFLTPPISVLTIDRTYYDSTVGFSQNRDSVAPVQKSVVRRMYHIHLQYIANLHKKYDMYVEVQPKHNSTMVSDASPGTADPKINESLFIQRRCLPTVHAHRMATSNVPIRPLLMMIRGWTVVGFVLVLELADV